MKCSAHRSVFACLLVTLSLSLIGCSNSFQLPDTITPDPPMGQGTGDIQGFVHGGYYPVAGADIYLYGAPNSGYSRNHTAPSPISLLGNTVSSLSPDGQCDANVKAPLYYDGTNCYYLTGGTTNTVDPRGGYNLSGLYRCNVSSANAAPGTLKGQQVWIYSIGGVAGASPVGDPSTNGNVQAGLAAALGTCNASTNNFSTYTYIYVNEVSTVAFAYALAGFASDAQHVSAPSTNYGPSSSSLYPGLTNAFNNAALLYDIFGGSDPGNHGARHLTPNASGTNLPTEGNGTDPYVLINSVANSLAACIDTVNTTAEDSTSCAELFYDVYGENNVDNYPIDTASLAIFIAQNPSPNALSASVSNIIAIGNNSKLSPPFAPNYITSGAPAIPYDLTAGISYSGISTPVGVAIDGSGDAYISSSGGTITELSPKGITAATSAFVGSDISYITIDSGGNIWTPSTSAADFYQLNSGLSTITAYPVPATNFAYSLTNHQITADGAGLVYVADAQNSVIWYVKKSGAVADYNDKNAGKDTCSAGITGIAYDGTATGYIWTAGDGTTDNICQLSAGAPATGNVVELLTNTPSYIAVDSLGHGWSTSTSGNDLVESTSTAKTTFTGGALESPSYLTIDGGGDIWIINNAGEPGGVTSPGTAGTSLSEFNKSGSAITSGSSSASGYQYNLLSNPSGIAVDQSGDVWVTNTTGGTNGYVLELIGAGYPTVAPLVKGPGALP